MITALAAVMLFCIFIPCRADDTFVIETAGGSQSTASVGDVIRPLDFNVDGEYTVEWYCGGELIAEGTDPVAVTADMLGKSVYAVLKTENGDVKSNTINIPAQPPTLELSYTAGDYSVTLNWRVGTNGSAIDRYDLSYALEITPDTIINTVTLDGGETSYTVTGLLGNTSYIFRLTAYNEAGSTPMSVTGKPKDPDLEAVTAVRNRIEKTSITIPMNLAETAESAKEYLMSYFSQYKENNVKIDDVTVSNFKAAEKKTQQNPNAPTGSLRFIVELSKGSAHLTTKSLSAVIDNSTSIVYLTSDKYTAMTGEIITVTANKVDINSDVYVWYRAENENGDGTVIENEVMSTYSPDTSKADDFYLYCVCGGVYSERIHITIKDPFIKVTDVKLTETTVKVHEKLMLRAVISPANASASNIVWSIVDDGGCKAKLSMRTLTAERAGKVIIRATVTDGLENEDFTAQFEITVTEDAKETEPVTDEVPDIYETVIERSAGGIASVSMTVENGSVQLTGLSDRTLDRLMSDCGLSKKDYNVTAAVKFVYSQNAVAENVTFDLTDKSKKDLVIITVNSNGATGVSKTPSTGTVTINTVSPDTVVILVRNGMTEAKRTGILLLTAAVPVIAALIFIPVGIKMSEKRKGGKK